MELESVLWESVYLLAGILRETFLSIPANWTELSSFSKFILPLSTLTCSITDLEWFNSALSNHLYQSFYLFSSIVLCQSLLKYSDNFLCSILWGCLKESCYDYAKVVRDNKQFASFRRSWIKSKKFLTKECVTRWFSIKNSIIVALLASEGVEVDSKFIASGFIAASSSWSAS